MKYKAFPYKRRSLTAKKLLATTGIGIVLILSPLSGITAPNTPAPKPDLSLQVSAVPSADFKYERAGLKGMKHYAEVACRVTNESDHPIRIETETDGWCCNWRTNSQQVVSCSWPSTANLPFVIILQPGQAYSKNVPVIFEGGQPGQPVTFQVRFYSGGPKAPFACPLEIIWSKPITISAPE
jgi:hypothetical protein